MGRDIYPDLPDVTLGIIRSLYRQLLSMNVHIAEMGKAIAEVAKTDHRIKLLQTIPGIGLINASAIVAIIGSANQFKNGCDLAAWIGLTPFNKSSGGKGRLGKISRMSDRYLRQFLVVGMSSWVRIARIIWAVLTKNEPTRQERQRKNIKPKLAKE